MILLLIRPALGQNIVPAQGIYFLPTAVPIGISGTIFNNLQPIINNGALNPQNVHITARQLSVQTLSFINYDVDITAISTTSINIQINADILNTGFMFSSCNLNIMLTYPPISSVFGNKLIKNLLTAPITASINSHTENFLGLTPTLGANTEVLVSILGWKADGVVNFYGFVIDIVSYTTNTVSFNLQVKQNTRSLSLVIFVFNRVAFTSNSRNVFGQSNFFYSNTSPGPQAVKNQMRLKRVTGSSSLQAWMSISGIHYKLLGLSNCLKIEVLNYQQYKIQFVLNSYAQYKYINATQVIFNQLQCPSDYFFTDYTFQCLLHCPSASMAYIANVCKCKSSLFVFDIVYKNCTCIPGYSFVERANNCLQDVVIILKKSFGKLDIKISPPLTYSINNSVLFQIQGSNVVANGLLSDAYLKISFSGNYNFIKSSDSDYFQIELGSIIYHWTQPYDFEYQLPSQIRLVGPPAFLLLPNMQFLSMFTHISSFKPFLIYKMLSFSAGLNTQLGQWQRSFNQSWRKLIQSSSSLGYSGEFLQDGLIMISALAIVWSLYIVIEIIKCFVKTKTLVLLKKLTCLLVLRSNQAFLFGCTGPIVVYIKRISNFNLKTGFSLSLISLYFLQLLITVIWFGFNLLYLQAQNCGQYLYFSARSKFIQANGKGVLAASWMAQWYIYVCKIVLISCFFVFDYSSVGQITILFLIPFIQILILILLRPFYRIIYYILQSIQLACLLACASGLLFFYLKHNPDSLTDSALNQQFYYISYAFIGLAFAILAISLFQIIISIYFAYFNQWKSDIELTALPFIQQKQRLLLQRQLMNNSNIKQQNQVTTFRMRSINKRPQSKSVVEVQKTLIRIKNKDLIILTCANGVIKRKIKGQKHQNLIGTLKPLLLDPKDKLIFQVRSLLQELGSEQLQIKIFVCIDNCNDSYQFGQELYAYKFPMSIEISYSDINGQLYQFRPQPSKFEWLPLSVTLRKH